jgi:DNA-binding protein H-NS
LQKDVSKAIAGFENRKKTEAKMALEAQAKEMGFTLEELLGRPVAGKRAKAAQKYRNPKNANVTWSGRGRTPRWFTDALAAGRTPDSLSA